ncbi:hypothetical protein RvY_09608-2 [Ramazzottius varieornatus]|uniref:G-protein coupled receptors family 1 profile domain-containing protein n=1 Tax=Ramazzottius varieornatus TaxID=947166 RepID=A0A1D1V9Y6_RAMVA|nr:hypothetical protein RvY_09608-2 [Ramazzottius varieornatus]
MANLSAVSLYDHGAIVQLDSYIEDMTLTNATLDMVPDGKEVHIIVTCVFTAIFIIGVVGNAMLIFTVARNLSMQIPPNIFLANMAVGDLLVVLISVPFATIPYITPSWPFGVILCKFNAMLQDISIGVSIFTLLILSVDRYVAIVTPFKLHNKRSTRGCSLSIKMKILAIWLVSAAFSVPDAINTSLEVVETMEDPSNVTEPILICSPYPFALSPQYHIGVVLGKFLVYFVLPVVFIVLVYSLMARQLISSTDMVPSHGNQQQLQKQMQNRKSLAKLFFIMVLVFVICFLPKHIFLIWFYGDPNSMENYNLGWHIFKIISHCLAYVNSW